MSGTGDAGFRPREAAVGETAGVLPREDGELLASARQGFDRRSVLKFLGISAALPFAACSAPYEEIVPYVEMPEGLVAGQAQYFATAFDLNGVATGLLAESHEGRPTKIEGNPDHPNSMGSTDAFHQAMVLSLYDPGRASLVRQEGRLTTYGVFLQELNRRRTEWTRTGGEGLAILAGENSSPTSERLLESLARSYPKMRQVVFEPISRENQRRGVAAAFGAPGRVHLMPGEASAFVCLDHDILGPGPEQVRLSRGVIARRRVRAGSTTMAPLLVAEPVLTATGGTADDRLACRRSRIPVLASAIAARLGVPGVSDTGRLNARETRFAEAAAKALRDAGANALLTVGEAQPPTVHAVVHRVNAHLGSLGRTVSILPSRRLEPDLEALAELTQAMAAGTISDLFILGVNPVYSAPADIAFEDALGTVPFSAHLSLYEDETSETCRWHVPQLHPLEEWADGRTATGLASIVQPLVSPLYEGHSPLSVLAAIGGQINLTAHEIVTAYWQERFERGDVGNGSESFETFWREALARGTIEGTDRETGEAPTLAPSPTPAATIEVPDIDGFEAVFLPDPSVWDGRFSNNAWLQELPRPITKEVWGNAAAMNPKDVEALGIGDGGLVTLTPSGSGGPEARPVLIPVISVPGIARGTIGLALGYGRRFGSIARGIGADVGPLRVSGALWMRPVDCSATGASVELALTQHTHQMHGREIVREVALSELAATDLSNEAEVPPTLYPEFPRGPYEWAMVIDQTACINCSACVVACQAENNVPVVGPAEIRRGRDMHWLRIDTYYTGEDEAISTASQPVPCMHCEKAPCEPMCPVEASIHDSEGLNVQVYNRCIGTRDCQANCPYKVRRFNFFAYNNGQEFADLGDPMVHAVHNPDVTVRARGVMEKCTYCVQRISGARREASREDRTIAEGEVVTACQQACPTEAISFGNLSEAGSSVNALRREPHHYALLEELGTRPRTTYLARVTNRVSGETGQEGE
ncbi:4Fe-4S dicluster domain-containing protein [Aurantimonas sp. 22II-16-19i]|uniref:4Fe-4S dicluster domain-containing protein n=1 Tax=Aurantimonas sp. 22II-16-19i TaxID=1317114 RepID=UPI0009F7E36F|nr:4Fe-4S dicluster domain-containing protein [Aurantimonas sp. 22II-16-19i]ORE98879.1 molybdopterin oxidoreductase, iron-sulfur binding subunit [Aurantimonas sp. 22II-16-19i]